MSTVELPALYVDSVALLATAPRLVLVNRDPSPAENGVPIDATLALELVDTGADGVDRATARVWIDGALAFEGGASTEIAPAYAGPLADVVQAQTRCASCSTPSSHSRASRRSRCACSPKR